MKIGNVITNPGELNKRLPYYKRTVISKTGGFKVKDLVLIDYAWTKCVGVHGSEAWVANSVGAVGAMTLTRRYRSEIDATTVVKINDLYYETDGQPDDIQQRHEYLELKVKIVRPG